MIVEAGPPVIWTKPEDIPFTGKIDPKSFALPGRNGLNIGLADGSVRWLSVGNLPPAALAAAITRAGGETLMLDDPVGAGEGVPFIVPKEVVPSKPAPKAADTKPPETGKKKD
jgi:hypothetical protein